jgi:hypothetical protein
VPTGGPDDSAGAARVSPQHAHEGPLWTGNSVQQASQIGTEESCGRGEPQRVQNAGRRAQPKASMGLRSTRATARQREVSDGGTSNVSEPESLRKTHLTWGWRYRVRAALAIVYPDGARDSMGFTKTALCELNSVAILRDHDFAMLMHNFFVRFARCFEVGLSVAG